MMTFEAQYHGECDECGQHISPGDELTFRLGGRAVHALCPPDPFVKPEGKPCPRCFAHHPGEC